VLNFVPIGQAVEEIWPFSIFKWRLSAILDFCYAILDHPRRAFGGLCHCAKFGWIRCSSFNNIYVMLRVWLENAYSCPSFGFFGLWAPKWGAMSTKTLKRHILSSSKSLNVTLKLVAMAMSLKVSGKEGQVSKRLIDEGRTSLPLLK